MPAHNAIAPDKLARLVGLPGSPRIVDLRDDPAEAIPGSRLRPPEAFGRSTTAPDVQTIFVDADGAGRAASAAAIPRSEGEAAQVLEGGFAAWVAAGLVTMSRLPARTPWRWRNLVGRPGKAQGGRRRSSAW